MLPTSALRSLLRRSLTALTDTFQLKPQSALAGGIGLVLTPDGTMQLHNLSVLSSEGRSRSFDESADGYARGEGCGIVVLKPLEVALRDGDPIRAVIRGSGVNSDGWTKGVMLPSGEAQAELVKHVYETNGLDYGSTQYVEAHVCDKTLFLPSHYLTWRVRVGTYAFFLLT